VVSRGVSVGVVGDCALDVTVRPEGPLLAGGDRRASIALSPGGQGANVAVRLARRGLSVRLVLALGTDLAGAWIGEHLTAEGVEVVRMPARRTSTVISLLDAAGERSMLNHRVPLTAGAGRIAGALSGARWIHCSGYLIRDRLEARRVAEALRRVPGSVISVAGGSFAGREEAATARDAVEAIHPDLLVMGRDEAAKLLDARPRGALDAARRLAGLATAVIVTSGTHGSAGWLPPGPAFAVPAARARGRIVDATGAGDAYVAALIAALADRAWPPDAAQLRRAMRAASRAGAGAARVLGAQGRVRGERRPATVDRP
jgi:sugar/nucleoside kinase (ribokinase family)